MVAIASGQEITYKHYSSNNGRKLKIRSLGGKYKKDIFLKFQSTCLGIDSLETKSQLIQLTFDAWHPGVIFTFLSSESKAIPHDDEQNLNKTKYL